MTQQHDEFVPTPRIQTPCPKRWDELTGDDCKRFCSQCSLHVHNGTALTRAEATTLVATATERVCMRLEFDTTGAPIFKDSLFQDQRIEPRRSFAARVAGWATSAAAGVLAACSRTTPPECVNPPLVPVTTHSTTMMGKVAAQPEMLGDVAAPTPPANKVKMGEATAVPAPPTPIEPIKQPPLDNIIQNPHQLPR